MKCWADEDLESGFLLLVVAYLLGSINRHVCMRYDMYVLIPRSHGSEGC
jgi:hypothetical protein